MSDENDLEEKFNVAYDTVSKEMKIICAEMSKLYERAAQLSEEHGIPVQLKRSTYVPESMNELFGDLDNLNEMVEFINVNPITW